MMNKKTIDMLVKENERLRVKRQRIEDKTFEENSRIETAIKELENRAYRNKQLAEATIAQMDRAIEKNEKQINLEAEYYNKIAKAIKDGGK